MSEKMIVTLTTDELAALVQGAVAAAVAKLPLNGGKEVLTLEECAQLLSRHERIVMKRLVEIEGLPCHYISEREPRFLRTEVLTWLAARPGKKQEEAA